MSPDVLNAFITGIVIGLIIAIIVYVVTGSHSHPRKVKDKDRTWPR